MPATAPPARYDSPWKAALTHAFRDFMAFFFAGLHTEINWSKRPRFRDKELAGISLGGKPGGLIADKLVEVHMRDSRLQWVLLHIEVQAQRDTSLPRRILDYNYRITSEYHQPVGSLVLLADESPRWRPQRFYRATPGSTLEFAFSTAKLLDYADKASELMASDNPFAWITLAHLRTQQASHDPDELYQAKWQLTKLLYQHGWRKQRIIVLFQVIEWMMVLPDIYQQRYWRAVLKLEKERQMEWISPMQQTFLNEGLERGRKEGALAIMERQLTRRFGPLPKTARKKLEKASLEQLEAWSDVLPEVQSLRQLFS
jgi:hypothetical protein